MNSQNQEKHRLVDYLEKEKPDIVFLIEVNESWAKEIKNLEPIYPYAKAIVREGNFGLALLSKFKLETEDVLVDRTNMIPALFLRTESSVGPLNLVLLHAYPPIGKYGTMMRDQYLKTLSIRIASLKSPLLVCGDFNTTPWTSIFQQFIQNSALRLNADRLLPSTWPTTPFLPKIPIDHCLSKGIDIVSYKKGPNIGSDHWPLIFKLASHERTIEDESR